MRSTEQSVGIKVGGFCPDFISFDSPGKIEYYLPGEFSYAKKSEVKSHGGRSQNIGT